MLLPISSTMELGDLFVNFLPSGVIRGNGFLWLPGLKAVSSNCVRDLISKELSATALFNVTTSAFMDTTECNR